jgi:hypothetical protein
MNLLKVLIAAAGSGCAALTVTFILLLVTIALGGRGTARLAWLLPIYFGAVTLTFAVGTAAFHRIAGAWLAGSSGRWLATGLHAAASLVALVAVLFVTLVILNR